MASSINQPHGYTIAGLKGLAIASSFIAAGHLSATASVIPSLYIAADNSHRLAAQQFRQIYRATQSTASPAEIASSVICSGLAYLRFHQMGFDSLSWKLWAAAAASIVVVMPWTSYVMETPSQKLLWVAEVADSATKTERSSSGIGVKVSNEKGMTLPVPNSTGHKRDGSITPIEEFEPFEDMIVGEEYEQLKVKKLMQRYDKLNVVRAVAPMIAGCLSLWATLTE